METGIGNGGFMCIYMTIIDGDQMGWDEFRYDNKIIVIINEECLDFS